MSAIDTLLAQNARYADGFEAGDRPAPPARKLAVLACMDARVVPAALLDLGVGDAHVIRNAGGIVTDDVIRSLMVSQRLLGTREVMLIHHTGCGMMTLSDQEVGDLVERAAGTRPPFPIGTFTSLEASVRDSVARLKASPYLEHKDAIRGFVYDIATGRLSEVS